MDDNSKNNKRIAKNTLVLYFRMLFLMLVSLYTARVILDTLGVEDYGIYNVVGGFVAMFGIISSALTAACTRFLNFEMGKDSDIRLNVVFSTSVTIQITLAIIVAIVAETLGLWYLNNYIVMPPDRQYAATWCFHFSVITFCANLITVPYNASIVAHEQMKAFAYVSIIDGLSKLGICFLIYESPFDKLISYGLLLFVLQMAIMSVYRIYCRNHFSECHFKVAIDKILLKEMLSFSVWQFWGNTAAILRTQGLNVLLNFMFGPTVNAAKGVANQALHAITGFASNFMMAMNPQITQSYAKGDYQYTIKLLYRGSKLSFFMLFFLSLPIIINADYILHLWLKIVPEYAVVFVQLSLILSMIENIMKPLITAQNATGKVKKYMIVLSAISLLNLPISCIVLYWGASPASVYIVAIILAIIVDYARLIMLHENFSEFVPWHYTKKILIPSVVVVAVSTFFPFIAQLYFPDNFSFFVLNCFICCVSASIAIFSIGCTNEERQYLYIHINKLRKKMG